MAQPVSFSNEFLPQVIRMFFPGEDRITGKVDWFKALLTASGRDASSTTVMLRGESKLLAFACLYPMECRQPGLVYTHIAIDPDISLEEWHQFWLACSSLAIDLVSTAPHLRIISHQGHGPAKLFPEVGLSLIKELTQFTIQLETVGEVPVSPEFKVASLASHPNMEGAWLQAFNLGLTALWDQPMWDQSLLKRRSAASPESFRVGLAGEVPVAALFYEVVDTEVGLVKIIAAATPAPQRNKGYGRLMLKDVLAHLQGKGYRQAYQIAEGQTQATALLFKMQGFSPQSIYQVWEGQAVLPQPEVSAAEEPVVPVPSQDEPPKKQMVGFYPMFHSNISKKEDNDK